MFTPNTHEPKHAQLSENLAAWCAEHLYPGDALPSERELMDRYQVSRATVRRALDTLQASGLVERIHGRGTFLASPREQAHLLASFSAYMRKRGMHPSSRLDSIAKVSTVPTWVASVFGEGEFWRIERVRMADGIPVSHEINFYPVALAPDLGHQDLSGSLYTLFADRYNLVIDAADQHISAEIADVHISRSLGLPLGAPLLVLRRTSIAVGKPVECSTNHYRGDRFEIHVSVPNEGAASLGPTSQH